MTKISKLYEQVRVSPGNIIAFRDFERLLAAFGFVHKRSVGSHRHYRHPDVAYILTVNPGREAKRYQVRQLLDMIDEHGLRLIE